MTITEEDLYSAATEKHDGRAIKTICLDQGRDLRREVMCVIQKIIGNHKGKKQL